MMLTMMMMWRLKIKRRDAAVTHHWMQPTHWPVAVVAVAAVVVAAPDYPMKQVVQTVVSQVNRSLIYQLLV
jgi:anti-sigma-K factor RskA